MINASMLSFARTSLADGMLTDPFPIKKKTHKMKKRRFQVYHANTERFKKSPILTMQRMLNEAEQK